MNQNNNVSNKSLVGTIMTQEQLNRFNINIKFNLLYATGHLLSNNLYLRQIVGISNKLNRILGKTTDCSW